MSSNNLIFNFNSNTSLYLSFTNPLGKSSPLIVKSGGATTREQDIKRGAVGSFSHQFITNSTPNLKLNGGKTK